MLKPGLFAALVLWTTVVFSQETSYILIDVDNNIEIKSSNEEIKRPIGSITKLMTVLVILNSGLDLTEMVPVSGIQPSRTGLRKNMKVSRKDLIKFSIISSDNLAAETLARTYPGGINTFVAQMNQTAYDLGMLDTEFEDPSGVGAKNLSTLHDINILTQQASRFDLIQNSSQTVKNNLIVVVGKTMKYLSASTTNYFTTVLDIQAAKTGFTSRAGRCLTMLFSKDNKKYSIIILGAKNPNDRDNIVFYLLSKI